MATKIAAKLQRGYGASASNVSSLFCCWQPAADFPVLFMKNSWEKWWRKSKEADGAGGDKSLAFL